MRKNGIIRLADSEEFEVQRVRRNNRKKNEKRRQQQNAILGEALTLAQSPLSIKSEDLTLSPAPGSFGASPSPLARLEEKVNKLLDSSKDHGFHLFIFAASVVLLAGIRDPVCQREEVVRKLEADAGPLPQLQDVSVDQPLAEEEGAEPQAPQPDRVGQKQPQDHLQLSHASRLDHGLLKSNIYCPNMFENMAPSLSVNNNRNR